jgi:hypothetical protein
MTVQGVYLFSEKHARKILSVLVECTHSIACTQEIPLSAAMLATLPGCALERRV